MRREDCRRDCVGPYCEGCRKFVPLSSDVVLDEVRAFLEKSRKEHYYCDDCWYTCPKHQEGSCNENYSEDECICGADEYNAELDIILKKLESI